jgi:hypothetical protein
MQREYVFVAMRLPRFTLATLMSAMLISCAHGAVTELPTSPGPVPAGVTIQRLTITPTSTTLIAGNAAQITSSGPFQPDTIVLGAFAQYSDGSSKYVPATWTSSNTQVIAIDSSTLTAVGRGTATITARAEGMTATAEYIVEPNVAGTWSGNFVVDQCAAGSGSMQELVCGDTPGHRGVLPAGTSAPITFTIEKNGADLTARAASGDWRGVLIGTDRGQNFLMLKGDLTGNRATVTIIYWDSRVKTDLMEGFLGFEVRIDGVPSNAAVTAHFDNVTRR